MDKKLIALLAVLGGAAVLTVSSMFYVTERQQAIVVQFGEPIRTIVEPGLNFKKPFIQDVVKLEKRILSLDLQEREIRTKDNKQIVVDSFARFRISDPLNMYQSVRTEERAASRLRDNLESNIRQVIAEAILPQVMSEARSDMMTRIRDITNSTTSSFGVEIVDVRLKRVDLPPANSQAVFDRMRTERQREAAEKRAEGQKVSTQIRAAADLRVAEIEAEAELKAQTIRGEADGQAVKIFAEAFGKDEDFFEFYRTMQAYKKALGSNDTRLVLSPDSEFFKFFMNDEQKKAKK
jgi:membrane protease subunit HflC